MNENLISEQDSRWLSSKLYPLGTQWQALCDELAAAGLGAPSAVVRQAILASAESDAAREQVLAYWEEWAKERLAGLVGPMDILRGKLPAVSAYRSELLDRLRSDAAAGKLQSNSLIKSPQIEPTIKRHVETLAEDPRAQKIFSDVKAAMVRAVQLLQLPEREDFSAMDDKARHLLLIERYQERLAKAGFVLGSHRKTGLVFRKPSVDQRWEFVLIGESKDDIRSGKLSPMMALTVPKQKVLPADLGSTTVATFSPYDLVPNFHASTLYLPDSYAHFCLAIDTVAFFAERVFQRIDALLVG